MACGCPRARGRAGRSSRSARGPARRELGLRFSDGSPKRRIPTGYPSFYIIPGNRTPDNGDQWPAVAPVPGGEQVGHLGAPVGPQSGNSGFDSPMDHQKDGYPPGIRLFTLFRGIELRTTVTNGLRLPPCSVKPNCRTTGCPYRAPFFFFPGFSENSSLFCPPGVPFGGSPAGPAEPAFLWERWRCTPPCR